MTSAYQEKNMIIHTEQLTNSPTISACPPTQDMKRCSSSAAATANNDEHSMSLRQGILLYPKAIMWSVLLSTALIMEGFDTILLANLFVYPPFKQQFGTKQPDGTYELTAGWQSSLSNGALVGEILGLFASGIIAERVGYRWTLIGALGVVMAFVFLVFFAETKEMLLVGEIMLGMPWGVFQTITTAYAAEVCPVALRAYLTTYINACWVFGQLLASIVLRIMVARDDKWGYKIPFALQWVWPLPIMIFVYLAPESPWWLVRKSRLKEARQILVRLRSCVNKAKIDGEEQEFERSISGTLEMMCITNEREKDVNEGTMYLDCFKGTNRRRTEIACMCWIIQTLCGSTLMGYSTYFYEQAGVPTTHAFTLSLIQFSLGLFGVLASWILMARFGRRTLYLSGQTLLLIFLLGIGILSLIPPTTTYPPSSFSSNIIKWTIAALLLAFTLTYDATIGPICYSLVSEIPSTRLRSRSIVLARNCYNISGILTNVFTPRMLNPTAWNWGARSAWFWAGLCAAGLGWAWGRLPEPRGRTFAELDELFEARTPARKFHSTRVEAFGSGKSGARNEDEE